MRNYRTVEQAVANSRWTQDVAAPLSYMGLMQCMELWREISTVDRNLEMDDEFSWPASTTGAYTAGSTYERLSQGLLRYPLTDNIWRNVAPLKCRLFVWLAAQKRVWTSDRRFRHGLQDHTSPCFICLQEEDTIEHILIQCPNARQVWFRLFQEIQLQVATPTEHDELQTWWLREASTCAKKDRKNFNVTVIMACWSLWKHRNAWAFSDTRKQYPVEQHVRVLVDEVQLWIRARRGGGNGGGDVGDSFLTGGVHLCVLFATLPDSCT